ncbi:MAG: hypothetical protein H7335_11200 [Massilia sp.]|nr:hypothetical protein [Massilia sp.]
MGSTLHNKIYLGRTSVLASPRLRLLLTASTLVSIGLAWMMFRSEK